MIDCYGQETLLQMILVVKSGMSETWFFFEIQGFKMAIHRLKFPTGQAKSQSVCGLRRSIDANYLFDFSQRSMLEIFLTIISSNADTVLVNMYIYFYVYNGASVHLVYSLVFFINLLKLDKWRKCVFYATSCLNYANNILMLHN